MNWKLAVIVGLVIITSGCMSSNTPIPEEDGDELNRSEGNNTVFYTDQGFTPETLNIERGETVTWLDRSDSHDMWVASNRHPSHTNYPESGIHLCSNPDNQDEIFDSCQSQESYSFTFDQFGSWRYHNHELSGHEGQINVG
jgi:plastocyanin